MPPTLRTDGNQERREDGKQSKGYFTMNEIEQVTAGALAPSDYATYELAKQNDGIIGGSDIAQIRSYAAYARAQAEAIHKVIANANNVDDIGVIKTEAMETASTYSRVSIFADMRIGELLRELPKRPGARTDITYSQIREEVKADALRKANISTSEANRLEHLADHPDVVESVIAEADEKGEIVSRNKVLKAIKEAETPEVRTCRKCGVELTDENTYPSQRPGKRYHANICKHCHDDKSVTINNVAPQWTIGMLVADLTANAPTWRNIVMSTFAMYAEYGVNASQKSIDAINKAFDGLDTAIAGIVEG